MDGNVFAKEVADRIQDIQYFCRRLEKRLRKVYEQDRESWEKPARRPLIQLGYTKKVETRFESHQKHSNSNFLMNLVESVAHAEDVVAGKQQRYRFRQLVIYSIWNAAQSVIGEVLLTRICQGYTNSGFGLSFRLAGRNNWSIRDADVSSDKMWEHREQHVMDLTSYLPNMQREIERRKSKQAAWDKEHDLKMNQYINLTAETIIQKREDSHLRRLVQELEQTEAEVKSRTAAISAVSKESLLEELAEIEEPFLWRSCWMPVRNGC